MLKATSEAPCLAVGEAERSSGDAPKTGRANSAAKSRPSRLNAGKAREGERFVNVLVQSREIGFLDWHAVV